MVSLAAPTNFALHPFIFKSYRDHDSMDKAKDLVMIKDASCNQWSCVSQRPAASYFLEKWRKSHIAKALGSGKNYGINIPNL